MSAPIRFLASFPDTATAHKWGGTGGRVQFDVPQTELAAFKRMLDLDGQVLVVTVETEGAHLARLQQEQEAAGR